MTIDCWIVSKWYEEANFVPTILIDKINKNYSFLGNQPYEDHKDKMRK